MLKVKNLKAGDHINFDRPKPEGGRGVAKVLRNLGNCAEVRFDHGGTGLIGSDELKNWNVNLIQYEPSFQVGDRVRFQFLDGEREGTIGGFYPNGNALCNVDGIEAGIEMQTSELELVEDESSNEEEGAITPIVEAPLSQHEKLERQALEREIFDNLKSFVKVGTALMRIREKRLYRGSHDTFEQYCEQVFDLGRRQADRDIAAAEFVERIRPTGLILPTHESQIRDVLTLPPDQQVEVWQEVVTNYEKPTAKVVKEVVQKLKTPRDSSGSSRQGQEPSPPPQREVPQAIRDSAELLFGKEGEIIWLEGLEHAVRLAATAGERIVLTDKLSTALFSTFPNAYLCIASAYGLGVFYLGRNELDFYEAFNGLGGGIWSRMVEVA